VTAGVEDYRWLVSEEAEPWLGAAREEVERGGGASAGVVARLRKDLSVERVHLVVEQLELRARGREKFARAEEMFFTRKGLEQATDEWLARYKAQRFEAGAPVFDLCCGIGGDLISLAERGPVTGADSDAVVGVLAAANLRAHGVAGCEEMILVADAAQVALGGAVWHCDPDRRAQGRRATRGELFEPSLDTLGGLLVHSGDAAIKLAPATEAPAAWGDAAELEWLGSRGECRQQVAWFGGLARHPGGRTATVVNSAGISRTIRGDFQSVPPSAIAMGRYVYEPQAAVLAAKLEGVLCHQHGLAPISAGIAYLTGDERIEDRALDGFEVCDVLPLDRKQLREYCRERQIGRLEIKKRRVEVEPERLRKEIVAEGDNEVTLLVAPVAGRVRVIVGRRLMARSDQ
jgi:hypothetical protein